MSNVRTCTHIKVPRLRCGSPALRGEQFCYFHQHAHFGVQTPRHSRLHPVALIESEEAIQSSIMEVINGLIRGTLEFKRAELILRALNIAVRNIRRVNFEPVSRGMVRDVPNYPDAPATAPDLSKVYPPLPTSAELDAAKAEMLSQTKVPTPPQPQPQNVTTAIPGSPGRAATAPPPDPAGRKPPVSVKDSTLHRAERYRNVAQASRTRR